MANFPSNVGGEIPLEDANERIAAFQSKYRDDPGTFNISPKLIGVALSDPELTGLRFCLGYGEEENFAPVVGGSTLEGKILSAYNRLGAISLEEYNDCSGRWEANKPYNLNWVFIGRDCLEETIKNFPEASIEVCSDLNGDILSMCLLVQDTEGMKGDDGTQCALNNGTACPPVCGDDD